MKARFFALSQTWYWPILGVGLLIRLLYALWLGEALWAGDGLGYLGQMDDLLSGESYLPYWPPGLPYYLAIWKGLFGETFLGISSWMLLWYVALHHVLLLALQQTPVKVPPKWQRRALWLLVCFPAFLHHSVAPLTHLPVAVLLLTAWVCIKKDWSPMLLGLALGLMILIRPASGMVVPVLCWIGWREKSYRLPHLALGMLLLLLPLSLWQYQAYQMRGYWVHINHANSYNLWLGNHPFSPHYKNWWLGSHQAPDLQRFGQLYRDRAEIEKHPPAAWDQGYRKAAWENIAEQPLTFFRRLTNRARVFFAFDTFTGARLVNAGEPLGWLFLCLDALAYALLSMGALLGLVFGKKGRVRPLLWLILAYAFPYLLAFSHPSYHLAVLPFFFLLAAEGIPHVDRTVWKDRRWLLALGGWTLIQLEWLYHMLLAA